MSRLPASRLAGSAEAPAGFRHRPPHFGVLASSARCLTFGLLGDTLLPIPLALFAHILTLIGTLLALIGRLLTIAGDAVALIGDAISFVGSPLAPLELALPPRE